MTTTDFLPKSEADELIAKGARVLEWAIMDGKQYGRVEMPGNGGSDAPPPPPPPPAVEDDADESEESTA